MAYESDVAGTLTELCRAPASAPAVRICSTVSPLEGGIASVVALI